MPRPNRGPVAAGAYHVFRRSAGPVEMFSDDFDRTMFCNWLATSIKKHSWKCAAFVLMTTHFHLLVEVEEDVLPKAMHTLFAPYAQAFNRISGRSGHLKGGPYKLNPVYDDRGVRVVTRYIARNPVEAGLCERPQDWIWGSYSDTAGYSRRFPFIDDTLVLNAFSEDTARAREWLREYVEEP